MTTVRRVSSHLVPTRRRAWLVLAACALGMRTAAAADGILLDGFDVDLNAAYFVSSDGSDANPGSAAQPFGTIGKGIMAAAADGVKKNVVVAAGVYDESLALANGVNVYGEFTPGSFVRAAGNYSIVTGASTSGIHESAVVAAGITTATVFDGFVVFGPFDIMPGGNSYAVYIAGSNANLQITNNVIVAGHGGAGVDGANGPDGADGIDGGSRDVNLAVADAGYDAFVASGTGECNTSNNRQLANGGKLTCGATSVSGGDGGGNRCPAMSYCDLYDANYGCLQNTSNFHWNNYTPLAGSNGASGGVDGGSAGSGAAQGNDSIQIWANSYSSYICYVPPAATSGGAGSPGGNGVDGSAGTGCASAIGSVVAGDWVGGAGADGATGGNGGGGGGGGAGGGSKCENDGHGHAACAAGTGTDTLGAHGGGGGSGGCGGAGGAAGGSGGGAFGIFVVGAGSAPTISANRLVGGVGGRGGNGGNGGASGSGGLGGRGGTSGVPAVYCADVAGAGGDGGYGGYGGAGGGGCGGASIAIYATGVGSPNYCQAAANNLIEAGSAGAAGSGGLSQVNPGGAGQDGVLAACSFQ